MPPTPSSDIPLPRRSFLQASVAAVSGASLAACAGPQATPDGESQRLLSPGQALLFQGDSITDAGRSREHAGEANHHDGLGGGYAGIVARALLGGRPEGEVSIYNRGISGNRVPDLNARWEADCVQLAPDVLSILIGVNDIWHTRNGNYDGTPERYEAGYDALLARTRKALPEVRLVVCEPFVLRCGAVDKSWFPEFDAYREAARRVGAKHGATWVPFHEDFVAALDEAPAEYWAADGVHPSKAGAARMAKAWLAAVRG